MNVSTICTMWRAMAAPLPLKARQSLAIKATLQQARAAAPRRTEADTFRSYMRDRARAQLAIGGSPYDNARGAL